MVLSLLAASRRRLAMTALAGVGTLFVPAAGPATAGVDRWTEIAPEGGGLDAIGFDPGDPSRLYAAGGSGAFVSTDRGALWHRLRGGLPLGPILRFQTVNGAPGVLYAIGARLLHRSTDGGMSWQPLASAPPGIYADLAAADDGAVTLLALVIEPDERYPALFRSRDGGERWQRLLERVECFLCGIAFDPFDPAVVYLWSRRRVRRSLDGGDTWTDLPGPPRTVQEGISHLALAPSLAGTLYALVGGAGPTRLWVSRDGGVRWEEPGALPFFRCQRLGLHASEEVLFALCDDGIAYRSDDGGARWAPAAGLGAFEAIATDPADGSLLHAARRLPPGTMRSEDGGRSWQPASRGIRTSSGPLRLAPSDPLTVYMTDGCRLLFSEDGGESWDRRSGPPACTKWFSLEAVAVADRFAVYASVPESVFSPTAPLYRSRDAGLSWALLGTFPRGPLTPHPTDPALLLAGEAGIHRSDDGGASWREVLSGQAGGELRGTRNIFFGAGAPPDAFATVVQVFTGIAETWISRDGGVTWGLGGSRRLLAVVPGEPSELYARPVFGDPYEYSPDGGQTWHELDVPGEGLVVVPSRPPVLYTGGAETALVSRDRGESWSPVPGWTELKPSLFSSYAVHPRTPETLISRGFRATFADAEPLTLRGGRIEVRVAWRDNAGRLGTGQPHPISDQSGAFWFFRPDNLELAVKALDGRPVNGRFWSFAAPLTTLAHEITVLDTATGRDLTWLSLAGDPRSRADLRSLVELLPPAAAFGGG